MSQGTLFATFYSFKGGVGRTLTLVNTAVALTQQGHSVIIWDMDIEAPGVQNIPYFYGPLKGKIKGGFVDIASDFKKSNYDHLDSDKFSKYVITHPENQKLRLFLTGNLEKEEEYSRKFSAIEWERLFGKNSDAGYRLFETIREELLKYHPDFVLIDSRTGFTDIGGVCSIQLPDLNFLVFTYGNQNLRGIRTVYNSVANEEMIKRLRPDRPLKNYLIASMVPTGSSDLRKRRLEEWERYDLSPHVEIPYSPEMVFNETVWAAEYPDDPFCEHYRRIGKILIEEKRSQLPDKNVNVITGNLVLPGFKVEARASIHYTPEQLFEMKVADLFRLMGYDVEIGKAIANYKTDVFLTKTNQLETSYYVVECKRAEKQIGEKAVRQIYNYVMLSNEVYPSCRGIVIANNGFTDMAVKYAAKVGITLRTYDELLNGIINFDRYISYIKTLFAGTELEKNYIGQDVLVENAGATQAMSEYVDEWLAEPQGGFFTLLGDYGTGKTSFTKKLSHDLAVRYETDKTKFRVPVLINLKDVSKALSLENIIFEHFSKTCQMNVLPETALYLLKEGKLLLIFDGFDEMATQSNAALTMKNFMELNRAFMGSAKVILTCRTHYFKDRAETEETLKATKRGLSESATELYRAIQGKQGYTLGYLQEFKTNQIEGYLKKTLPETWREAKSTIDSVYNLKDLSSRPVLLDMIVKSLPKIREKEGNIQAADLYAAYVHSWIDREDWRHELTREGREFLVEEIAEKLWDMETDRVHHSLISNVLRDYLQDKKGVVSVNDIELASSEVRTASFLTRDDDGNYGFAHRSFMEFFLSQRLAKKLREGDIKCLRIKRLSKEVILFLSQLTENSFLIETARKILSQPYQRMISENALFSYYWTLRYQCMTRQEMLPVQTLAENFRQNRLDRIFLEGANLDHTDLSGICLEYAQMDGAHLNSSILTGASLNYASLPEADLSFSSLDSADLTSANMTRVKADHALFNFSKVNHADFTGANLYAANFIAADMNGVIANQADISFAGLLGAKNFDAQGWKIDNAVVNKFGMGFPDTPLSSLSPSIQLGHSDSVAAVAISPDGKMVASASKDDTVKLWDAKSGKEIRTLRGHSDSVTSVAFSPDGKRVASASQDNTVRLWVAEDGTEIRVFHGHLGPVASVAFSPDGKWLVSGSKDNTVRLWDVGNGEEIRNLQGHSEDVRCAAFSPNGKLVASGSPDSMVKLWDAESGKEIGNLQAYFGPVASITFSPNGEKVAIGGWSKSVRLLDVESGKEIRSLQDHSGPVASVTFSPDGRMLASGSEDNTVRLWDVESGKEIKSLQGHLGPVASVAFSPDGKWLVSGSEDNTVRLWDVEGGSEIRILQGHLLNLTAVSCSPDGKTIASGSRDNTVKLWDSENTTETGNLVGHSDIVSSVSFAPDGKTLASGSFDKNVKIWDVQTGRELKTLMGHSFIISVSFSPDGKTLASGGGDKTVKLWDIQSGRETKILEGHLDFVSSISFSPDGKILASGSYDMRLKLWDIKSGKELKTLEGHSGPVFYIHFSPDGKTLASGSGDKTVKLWDIQSGKEVRTLVGHSSYVYSAIFSPDGKTVASGSDDHTVKLWDSATGKELLKIKDVGSVRSIGFTPDGNMLISGNSEGLSQFSIIRRKGGLIQAHLLETLYHLPDGEWAAIAPDNRFVCSEGGRAYIYFNDRLALYPASDLPELEHPEGLGLIKRNQATSGPKK